MGEPEREILVILETAIPGIPPTDVVSSLQAFGSVVGRLRPRLVLLAAPGERAADVALVPGVAGAFTGEVPPHIPADFSDAERLFVDAWVARNAPQPAPPGDGLPWDSPGRLPPDLPPASPCTPGAGGSGGTGGTDDTCGTGGARP